MAETRVLSAAMDNIYAYRLGQIAAAAGDPGRKDIDDAIDRGLVLLAMLNAAGFAVHADYPALGRVQDGIASVNRS